jgi:hypothetical protein
MSIPNAAVVQLQAEGIVSVDDPSVDFQEDTVEQIAANSRRPAGRVPDPNPAVAAGSAVPTPPFVFEAESQQRLINTAELARCCDTAGRNTIAGNLQWTATLKNSSEQWKAVEGKEKVGDEPEIPKIAKALPAI